MGLMLLGDVCTKVTLHSFSPQSTYHPGNVQGFMTKNIVWPFFPVMKAKSFVPNNQLAHTKSL